jgi:hypothetical protein
VEGTNLRAPLIAAEQPQLRVVWDAKLAATIKEAQEFLDNFERAAVNQFDG